MGFNIKVSIHVIGLIITISLFSYVLVNTKYYATMLSLSILLTVQTAALLHYINSTNRALSRFLNSVKHSDFSQSFSANNPNSSFVELGLAIDGVIQRFQEERSDREAQASYLQNFIQLLPIPVFSINDNGHITVSNTAFNHLLGSNNINHLDQVISINTIIGNFIANLQPGREHTLKVNLHHEMLQLKITCTILRSKGLQQKLISIQNIHGELEANELDAWQKLIRVMTHEIMNSITPITSLSETTHQNLIDARALLYKHDEMPSEIDSLLEDVDCAITTMGKRSQGLTRFVQSYRTLTRLPQPKLLKFRINDLFHSVKKLMTGQAQTQHVVMNFSCIPITLELNADSAQLEQALINLLRNALDACKNNDMPSIEVSAELKEQGQININITDNGCGINQVDLENIFIPFFTTKRDGSGIGMSIVRQIVRLNGGKISILSKLGQGTSVILNF